MCGLIQKRILTSGKVLKKEIKEEEIIEKQSGHSWTVQSLRKESVTLLEKNNKTRRVKSM